MPPPSRTGAARRPFAFHVLAKPIGSLCNLDCTYCYYLHKEHLLKDDTGRQIADDVLEEFIRQYISAQETNEVVFTWHGGEATLLGLDFFRRIVDLQKQHAGGKQIENDLQTNGLLLDDSWCRFLKEHNFLVGLSIDGPQHLHDRFRVTKGGTPTFQEVYAAARLLQKHEVRFNVLAVINNLNAKHPEDVYNFFTQDLGAKLIQWLPCVERKAFCAEAPGKWPSSGLPVVGTPAALPGSPDSVVTDWSVDPDDFGEFLCRTFDLWYQRDLGHVIVNWFENLVGIWMGQPSKMCTLSEVCGRNVTLEKDGSLYSCDRFVYPEYKLGTIGSDNTSISSMVYSPRQRKFGCDKRDTLPGYCKRCSYRFACNGECPKNRFLRTPDNEPGLNYLCSGLKRFFAHADPFIREIVKMVYNKNFTLSVRNSCFAG